MKVKVLKIKGLAALVEWKQDGKAHRATIPAEELGEGGEVDDGVLAMAVPHGEPWAAVLGEVEATPQAVEDALHDLGVWTASDLLGRPTAAREAVARAVGADAAKLLRHAASKARGR